jgi:transposase-like protein
VAGLRPRPDKARGARRRWSSPTKAAEIWKATRELWPDAIKQRCTVHALRNITFKLPERHHRELKARYWQILDDATSVSDA